LPEQLNSSREHRYEEAIKRKFSHPFQPRRKPLLFEFQFLKIKLILYDTA
jgi:hypothetical protein